MQRDYTDYGIDDFLDDQSFRSFVYKENVQNISFWNDWIKSHPEKIPEIEEAIFLLRNIYVDNKELLSKEERENELREMFAQIEKSQRVSVKSKVLDTNIWHSWKRVAAILIVLLVPISVFYLNSELWVKETPREQVEWIEKVVPYGQKLTTTLSDGSIIKLNAGSRIRFPKQFSTSLREIFLEGEAFFNVERDTSRKFIIHTEKMLTTVLGTSFNIKAYPEDSVAEVAVATGKVLVQSEDRDGNIKKSVTLNANEMTSHNKTDPSLLKTVEFNESEFSWRDDILYFDKTPVPELIVMLERWYGKNIRLENDTFKNKTYSGVFENETLKNVLEGIKFEADINYKIKGNDVLIY
ncbi:FecR family protein [Fulvivirgaceae bacterium BMA10]|uniref:FecR family protein n=1 Tax=Splendidivirga corallicola TaxID=3051826 RepID=A0ABT8KWK6_9BACT|nr:FecR family protein [Fulvivirgaceae bacterium BMA10]